MEDTRLRRAVTAGWGVFLSLNRHPLKSRDFVDCGADVCSNPGIGSVRLFSNVLQEESQS